MFKGALLIQCSMPARAGACPRSCRGAAWVTWVVMARLLPATMLAATSSFLMVLIMVMSFQWGRGDERIEPLPRIGRVSPCAWRRGGLYRRRPQIQSDINLC